MLNTVKVRVPGTTANCGPGFDAIGIACTIYNELELSVNNNEKLTIEIHGEGAQAIPTTERNIVWQAVKTVFQKVGYSCQGVKIVMDNRIPLARGLGSSAAAIVGGLVAANAICENQLTDQHLLDLATGIEGHPDNVAPALFGGIALSAVETLDKGIRRAHCLRFIPPSLLKMVVAVPDFTLSTKASRQVLPQSVPLQDAVFNVSRTAILIGALCQGKLEYLRYALDDRLHQPYRKKLIPGMDAVFKAAMDNGALGVALSGAGPCLIAFTETNVKRIGEGMLKAFAEHKITALYHELTIDADGAKIIS